METNRSYIKTHQVMAAQMDKIAPGWKKDKKAEQRVKEAARKSVDIGNRIYFLAKKYNFKEESVRKLFMYCQSWEFTIEELEDAMKEKREISLVKVSEKILKKYEHNPDFLKNLSYAGKTGATAAEKLRETIKEMKSKENPLENN